MSEEADLKTDVLGALQGNVAEAAYAIRAALLKYSTVTRIDLNDTEIGDEGAKAIAQAVKWNDVLTHLDLNNNIIGDEAQAVKWNDVLTHLDLNNNIIGDEGAKAIAEMLKDNGPLTKLFLNNNQIGNEGAKAIAEALKENHALTLLRLNNNLIRDEGAKAIAEALKVNHTLTRLQFGYGISSNIGRECNVLCKKNKAKKLENAKLQMRQVHKIGGFDDDPRNTIDQLNYKALAKALVSVVTSVENTNSSFAVGL